MNLSIRKKDKAPLIIFGLITLVIVLAAIFVMSKKILIASGVLYYVLSNFIIAYRKWLRRDNIIISFVSLFFCWLFTWLFLKGIIGYGFMKWLLIFNFGLYILNAILIIVAFLTRKKRMIPHYISLVWFIITTIIISYILYIYVFSLIFMLSF